MRSAAKASSILLSLVLLVTISGCWNYGEVEEKSIVAGVAIDMGKSDDELSLTAELVDNDKQSQEGGPGFKNVNYVGRTMFDIVRNMISMTGTKLFWSHAKAIIISEELAREGLVRVIDWYSRDTETRSDMYIFITQDKNAREILELNKSKKTLVSFELAKVMLDEQHVNTAPVVQIWDFIDKMETLGQYSIAPLISIYEKDQQQNEIVRGTAVFRKDQMIGKLTGEETKYMLFANNKIKGGVIPVNDKKGNPTYSLEVLGNRTKVKSAWVNGKLQVQVSTITRTAVDEVMSAHTFPDFEDTDIIKKRAEEQMERDILAVIHKVQKEYRADIFGFGEVVHRNMPKYWAKLKNKWEQEFVELNVVVKSEVIIESTAKTIRSIKVGD